MGCGASTASAPPSFEPTNGPVPSGSATHDPSTTAVQDEPEKLLPRQSSEVSPLADDHLSDSYVEPEQAPARRASLSLPENQGRTNPAAAPTRRTRVSREASISEMPEEEEGEEMTTASAAASAAAEAAAADAEIDTSANESAAAETNEGAPATEAEAAAPTSDE